MRIVRTASEPTLKYPSKGRFKRPRGRQHFDDVMTRLRWFSRESLVTLGTRILWKAYREPWLVTGSDAGTISRQIVELLADRIVALACVYANDHRPPANELEFDLLCWELHNCVDEEIEE